MAEYIGKLNEEVYKEFVSLQTNLAGLSQRLGLIEFQKYELVKVLESANQKANDLMKKEAYRLGIPENTDWHITKDGEAYLGKAEEQSNT
jgi:hypothetical protein